MRLAHATALTHLQDLAADMGAASAALLSLKQLKHVHMHCTQQTVYLRHCDERNVTVALSGLQQLTHLQFGNPLDSAAQQLLRDRSQLPNLQVFIILQHGFQRKMILPHKEVPSKSSRASHQRKLASVTSVMV